MNDQIALCADSACLENPSGLGLCGERLADQTWLLPFADALIARKYLKEHEVAETWVVSSDSVDGINLAAALKKDNTEREVKLFIPSPSGSKMSRCQNAGIVPICGSKEFASLYSARKSGSETRDEQAFGAQIKPASNASPAETTHALPTIANSAREVGVSRIVRGKTTSFEPVNEIEIDESLPAAKEQTRGLPDIDTQLSQRISFDQGEQRGATRASARITPPLNTQEIPVARKTRHQTLPSTNEGASIVSIVSGSGGSGKSSVAALCALHAQNRGIRTLILDADFQFGDLKYLLGYKQTLDTSDILSHPEQIQTLLKADTWPALIAAPAQLEYSELMNEKIGELLAYLKPHFDLIVVNTGSSWSDLQMQLLEASNSVFFLIDQRPSSVRACSHALDLCSRCGIATTSFSYLLNFCSKKSLLSGLDVSCALQGAKVHEIKDGGAEVSELLGAGMAHKLSKINNAFCSSIEELLIETLYDRLQPPLANIPQRQSAKRSLPTNKTKHRARPRRRAACY